MRTFANGRDLARAAAAFIIRAGRQAVVARGRFDLLLSGGTTPRETYRVLARWFHAERRLQDRTHFYWGDERCAPPSSPASNYRLARRLLLEPLGVPPERIHRIRAELTRPAAAAAEYGRVCPPEPDLVLLGLGADGHTASLFPGASALAEKSRRFLAVRAPAAPRRRVTITPAGLRRARRLLVLVSGADKCPALARVFAAKGAVRRTPARLVRDAEWFVDCAAAGRLRAFVT